MAKIQSNDRFGLIGYNSCIFNFLESLNLGCFITDLAFNVIPICFYNISTQSSEYLICSNVFSTSSFGGCLILNFTAFCGTRVWIVN